MALDIQEQLALLRQRMAQIDARFTTGRPAKSAADPTPAPAREYPEDYRPVRYAIEEWQSGQEVETPFGKHFETERTFEHHRRFGTMEISTLVGLPHDLLDTLSNGTIPKSCPTRWAFLDTETTGLAGGSGTYAFLIGVGRIDERGFHVRQFFMRDYAEEQSLLHGLSEHLAQFDVLITYNGKTYDQPLLETRYRMARSRPPFGRMEHLDLLFGARRLWKLRLESCRLVNLENQILGVERIGDLPGEMIPYVYFEYLRTREAFKVAPILHHNVMDIVSLACLTAIVPWAFRSPMDAPLAHGSEMVGVARWLRSEDQHELAMQMFQRAVDTGLRDDLLFRTLWDLALLKKKLGRDDDACASFQELADAPRHPFRVAALQELAKHAEHRQKNYAAALEFTRQALALGSNAALHTRANRLERRLTKRKPASQEALPRLLRRVVE